MSNDRIVFIFYKVQVLLYNKQLFLDYIFTF